MSGQDGAFGENRRLCGGEYFWRSGYEDIRKRRRVFQVEACERGGEEKIVIREYRQSDCEKLADLFYDTVHTVNAKDYTKEQLSVWATGSVDLQKWNRSLLEHYSLVAVEGGGIAGFGDIDQTGYLDRLYVHKDYQRKGIATAICDELERTVQGKITTHASITARPFFEKRGYTVIKEQHVERQGIVLVNFVMEKCSSI